MPDSTPQLSQTKVCTKCNQEKPLSEFNRDRSKASGRHSCCKACTAETYRVWSEANKERNAEKNRAWYTANRERANQRQRAWKKANPEKVAEYIARHRARHPNRSVARRAVHNAVHRGKLVAAHTLTCACGSQAEHYHHYKGYAREHRLDVIPVCRTCHTELHKTEGQA